MSKESELQGSSIADRLLKKRETIVKPIAKDSGANDENSSRGRHKAEVDSAAAAETTDPEPRRAAEKSPKKDEKKEKFYTYMSAENYEEFEEMFVFVRKAISRSTGKKLKVTNMAELAIILAKKQLFDQDKEAFIDLVERELD